MVNARSPEAWSEAHKPAAIEDRYDRLARRLRVALGGAILGSSALSILGGAIGYDTPIVQLAGAVIGFVVIYQKTGHKI